MDTRLLKAVEKLKREEEAKQKKKKPALLIKEKRLNYYSGWTRKLKGGNNMEEKEIGRIRKSETIEVIIKVDEFKGEKGVNIREFMTTERYTGFTKSGTRIPVAKWEEFKKLINDVKLEDKS